MRGDYRVEFANGNQLDIHSDGELFLLPGKLVARLGTEAGDPIDELLNAASAEPGVRD